MSAVLSPVQVRRLGLVPYGEAWQAMRAFTASRDATTPDELWLLEHEPVYTLGQGAQAAAPANGIPLVQSDRGGKITYHGPGQVVLYALVDLARRDIKVKRFVWLLEQCIIDLLGPPAERRPGAPGIYVGGAKIAALGIRVARGRAYHGLALNVDMDLAPFSAIDPCGYPDLRVIDMRQLGMQKPIGQVGADIVSHLLARLAHA